MIAGEDGAEWCDAARATAAKLGVPLRAIRVGHLEGDYRDPRCSWLRQREIGRRGAVLVRPDRYVAWRSLDGVAEPTAALEVALTRVLGRPAA